MKETTNIHGTDEGNLTPVLPSSMQRFTMYRRNVPDATHDANQKNAPDEPQFEGVRFTDGTVVIRWRTAKCSTAFWASMEDMLAIHGHPEYGSELVWQDQPDKKPLHFDKWQPS